MTNRRTNKLLQYLSPVLVMLGIAFAIFPGKVWAAELTNRSDTLSRLKLGINASHLINFMMDSGTDFAAGETITLDFGEDDGYWAVNKSGAVVSDFGFNDGIEREVVGLDGDCAGHNGANDIAIGIDDTAGIISFLACSNFASFGNGANVIIEIGTDAGGTDRITNPSVANAYEMSIGGSFGDYGAVEVDIVDEDQVLVLATVDEVMGFAVSDNTIGFGGIDYTRSRYATGNGSGSNTEIEAHRITASANATGGYSIDMEGTTLEYLGYSIDPIGNANTAPVAGKEQFGIRLTASGGTGAVRPPYAAAGFAYALDSFPDEVAFSLSSSDNTIYSVRYLVSITEDTEGGIYTAELVYRITALF